MKEKMPRLKNKPESHRNQRRTADWALGKKVRQIFPDHSVIVSPDADGRKVSEIFNQFMEPYKDLNKNEQTYRKLIHIAIFSWNLMLIPGNERQSEIDGFVTIFPDNIRNEGRRMIEHMMTRKDRMFSQYRKAILGFELANTQTGWYLTVAASASSTKG